MYWLWMLIASAFNSMVNGLSAVTYLATFYEFVFQADSLITFPSFQQSHIIYDTGSFTPPSRPDGKPRDIPPPTPVCFPKCQPQSTGERRTQTTSLVSQLQSVHRPADIKSSHFEAIGIHVIPDASASEIIPWTGFLPPVHEWNSISQDDLLGANEATRKPLSNNNLSPGVQTYRERQKELLIQNTSAFRSIRRIPAPTGETAARLGNAYEFFKNLELFSGFWPDTSLPVSSPSDSPEEKSTQPPHLQTHQAVGTGSQVPADYRQHLISAFVKLVAYDFGCNVTFARTEPRLHLTPPAPSTFPSTYFNSSASFVFRTPSDRPSARSGIVEGPVAVLSARASTGFTTPVEENLDLAREIVAILLTAQQRARDGKVEKRFGEGKWWTSTPRWGGGPGGAIGKENDIKPKSGELPINSKAPQVETPVSAGSAVSSLVAAEAKRAIGSLGSPPPTNKRSKKSSSTGLPNGNLQMYENYRKLAPPAPTWDRKCRYSAIGKSPSNELGGGGYDDIFLISSLNHHVSVVRARVPDRLTEVLEGGEEREGWGKVEVWRSKWFDLYLAEERVEAMGIVWGMMARLMRKAEEEERMDLT